MSNLYVDERPGARVFIATTAYDSPDSAYTFAIAKSRDALRDAGIESTYCLLSGNCHVDDARNTVVAEFMATDCEALVFIDADVSWSPKALVRLCETDVALVGGVYPYRDATRRKTGEMPVRLIDGVSEPDDRGLLPVEGLPTGFMKIRRDVFEALIPQAETFRKGQTEIPLLFQRVYAHGTRWGGDLHFCNLWRAEGGAVYAIADMELGHTAKVTVRGSLASAMRRRDGTTLAYVADRVRRGVETLEDIREVREWADNPWGAEEDVLATAVHLARRADGPIIETGSGVTTILMAAAAPEQTVYCLEHDPLHAETLRHYARISGIGNIGLCVCPIVDGWYDTADKTLPDTFALGLVDGPPRAQGDRRKFFDCFDPAVVVCDDVDNREWREWLRKKAIVTARHFEVIEPRAAILSYQSLREQAA